VGGTEVKKVDVRIIAATNRDLASMVKQGTFREDLFYRLNVVPIRVPPLRERRNPDGSGSDVVILVEHFLQKLAKREKRQKILTPRALERLVAYDWPGNVRELENEIERIWVLSGEDTIIDEDLLSPSILRSKPNPASGEGNSSPSPSGGGARAPKSGSKVRVDSYPLEPVFLRYLPELASHRLPMPEVIRAIEAHMIHEGLRQAGGNKSKAARVLGISRRNLLRKLRQYGLDREGLELR
ncbi:MAG: sigma 54-interacting transcriptional regulator, partial [Deltaproteobacteria bacterium]|nr:sigma 54-interacting transcriptional regulator [Deltaproteobacteria bacterium]